MKLCILYSVQYVVEIMYIRMQYALVNDYIL